MSYSALKTSLENEFKKVLKAQISTNPVTLEGYKNNLIVKYNRIVDNIETIYENLKPEAKLIINREFERFNEKINNCFIKLNLEIRAPLTLLDKIEGEQPDLMQSDDEPDTDMAMSNSDLLKATSQTINYKYSGDPLQLESFIDAVRLMETFATTNDLKTLLFTIIKSKLDGRAREYITNTVDTTDAIITILREKIKPDNSAVIEGRFASLKINKNDTTDFIQKAENLADALRRSLIIEGVSPEKADSMAVTKTVELCRNTTQSDIVKSVIASTTFKTPKDVLAKYVTESAVQIKEKQILSFRKVSGNKFNTYNKNRNYNNNFRFKKYNRPQNNGFQRDQNNNQQRNFHNRRDQNRRPNHSNKRFVRSMNASGNEETPQTQTLGEE